jgi:uncharacterized membrane protein YkoI
MMGFYCGVKMEVGTTWIFLMRSCPGNLSLGGINMKKKWTVIVASSGLIIGIAAAGASFANWDGSDIHNGTIRVEKQSEADFPSLATISTDQAVQKALATVQGQVLKMELEEENGFLVYGVEVVRADKAIMDVKVDAGSGEVLAVERDKVDEEDHDEANDRDRED